VNAAVGAAVNMQQWLQHRAVYLSAALEGTALCRRLYLLLAKR
jgi:hypothetical protein